MEQELKNKIIDTQYKLRNLYVYLDDTNSEQLTIEVQLLITELQKKLDLINRGL